VFSGPPLCGIKTEKTMKKLLGKNWIGKLLVLFIIGFWPLVYFYGVRKVIEFNPAKFTEEWIKAFLTLVVLGTILKYYDNIIKKREQLFGTELLKIKIVREIDNFEFTDEKLQSLTSLISEISKTGYCFTNNTQLLHNAGLYNATDISDNDKLNISKLLEKLKIELQ
jgi:hypothetical protein